MIGLSAPMQRAYRLIHRASATDYPVLILGEKGTEKEFAARAIHGMGPRRNHPFVAVDCASLPPTLIESELFGYAKGAFFAASEGKWGRVAFAGGGTVFLDEIGGVPLRFQGKLLRMLQEGKFFPVGSVHPLPFEARVIVATSHDLHAEVETGRFQEDLYMQLNVMPLLLPPLRERKGDIPLLADLLAERCAREGEPRVTFSDAAMEYLTSHSWPGNVRELEETVRRAISIASEGIVRVSDLSTKWEGETTVPSRPEKEPLSLDDLERGAINRALRESAGDRGAAARLLRIEKSALDRKLKQYGLPPGEGREG